MITKDLRTWIEISEVAVKHNIAQIRSILAPKTALWAVVKSNAYGHGIFTVPRLFDKHGVNGFCVDTLMEGVRLRESGIKKPILVLGLTLPNLFSLAVKNDIQITISNFDILKLYLKSKDKPKFHIKLDTGMHRQGFYLSDLDVVIKNLSTLTFNLKPVFIGLYTHFASAKDINYPTYTEKQFSEYQRAVMVFEKAGFKNFIQHVAATGGTLINKKYHLDMVRCGIGLYGLFPSKELEIQMPKLIFKPILSWKTIIGEIKEVKKGDYIGYDLVERMTEDSRIAVLPIGYWHGLPRALSQIGEVLINGARCKILGRVSMDMIAVDVGKIKCEFGDEAVLLGQSGREQITAQEIAGLANQSYYELLTRINPLIERVII